MPRNTGEGGRVKRLNPARRRDSWVIYREIVNGEVIGPNGVCEQDEWEAMEWATPGGTFVIQSGIADERVAEKLARGASGEAALRVWRETAK
jgi:hypothetical protein